MHFVDDIHPIFAHGGGKMYLFTQIADVVHAVVGGSIDLRHIQHGTLIDAAAYLAFVARIAIHRMQAVDRFRQNFGAGGLAGSARSGEQIRVRQPSGAQFVFQRCGHMRLTPYIRKGLRPPFTVQHLIHFVPPPKKPRERGHTDRPVGCGARKQPLNAARFPA